jgi:TRAP-type C4-dicarboxylate transport system substrate-binding protein
MSKFIKFFSAGIIIVSSLTALADEIKTIVFKAAHGPYQVISKPLNEFKNEVEAKSKGRIKVELIIPDLQKETNQAAVKKTYDDVKNGTIQMSQIYTGLMAEYEKDFRALELPFIFKDHDHAFNVVDGEIGKNLLAKLEKSSPLKGLGYTYCGGYRLIASSKKRLNKLDDFKGLKMNIGSSMSASIMNELGADVVRSVSKENISEALAQKTIDAYDTVYPRYFHGNEFKTAQIANDIPFNTQFTVLLMNKKFFKSLSKADQLIVESAAQKASLHERKMAIQIAEDVKANASKYGIEMVRMSETEKSKLVEKLELVDWSKKQNISAEIIEKIKSLEMKKISAN